MMQQKNPRTRYYTRYILHYTKQNKALILLAILFLLGVLSATLLFSGADTDLQEYLLRMVDGFAHKKLSQELRANFLSAFSASMLFVGVLFVSGFCAIAQPVIVVAPLFRGLGIGFSLASLYMYYGAGAMGFAAIYMASALVSSIAMLVCCIEALRLSSGLFGAMRTGERASFYPMRRYLAKFLAATLLCVFAAALEAILYAVFANYVVFG